FPAPAAARLPAADAPNGDAAAATSRILVTIYYRDQPFDQAFADFFDRQARPALTETGAMPLACLHTEQAENTFPALPVRTGENVVERPARLPRPPLLRTRLYQSEGPGHWRDRVLPALPAMITGAPQRLRLAPTARSLLR